MRSAAGSRPTGGRGDDRASTTISVDVAHEGRAALRAELEALERELRQPEETVAPPAAGPPTAPDAPTAPNPATIAEAPTIAPRIAAHVPLSRGTAPSPVQER